MANKDDYLTEYRQFFEIFAQTVNPNDQLPVKLASYKLVNVEVVGGIIDWTSQYLTQKKCPQSLLSTLIKIIIDETRQLCKKQPVACGFNPADNAYEPLKLMQTVISITCEVCLRYLDNSKLCSLPSPGPPHNQVSAYAIRNSRRRMEDRHVVVHDLSSLFVDQESTPSSYYAIFDGHAGHDAAAYSCAHLHQFLAESKDFISNPEQALREAFYKTDALFLDKCKVESLSSGTTAVCALIHHKEKLLYIAWVGDSQAIVVSQGRYVQCVQPHKPSREDEKKRVEEDGGLVLFWDTWRVNGQLAVSRAIGDSEYKPYVTAVPDIVEISLNGVEDFLILACDGLWDGLSEDLAAQTVYSTISENPDDIESVSQRLVQLAKQQGSSDNITVIVVFLRETSKIAAEAAHWANCGGLIMDTLDNANANPFVLNNSNSDIILQKEGLLLDLAKQNGDPTTNGKRSADEEFDYGEDMGPETDVDQIDDVLMSPVSNKHLDNKKEEEKATLEIEHVKDEPAKLPAREDASTPPADLVHDTSGLIDNVAESCEDSDDEWNYYKGDTADKENIEPSDTDKEVCDIIDNDEMSHLNPNAAEFVPLSPKTRTESPALQALRDEPIIAQSPKRQNANNVDIKLPGLNEFECEIKSRPSDVLDSNKESDSKLSSEEIMVNFLNGKNIEEIEFHPVSTPIKTFKADEFHFGPNATPFSTPAKFDTSESLSTKAVFGDESSASYLERSYTCEISKSEVTSKEQDPMSTSFYQDKDDVEDSNPFDLNKVHVLPDNIEDFLAKPLEEFLDDTDKDSFFNDTISDLPEHDFASLDRNNLSGLQTQTQNTLANAFELHSQEVAKAFDEKIQEYPEDHNNVADALKSSTELPVSSEFQPVLSQLPQSLPPIHKEEPHFLLENSVTSHSPVSPQSPDIKVLIPPQLPTLAQTPSLELSPIPAQSHVFAESPVFTESVVSTKSVLSTESPVPEVLSVHTGAHVHVESPIIEIPPVHSESPVPSQSSIHSELHVSTHSPIPSESFIHFKSSVLPHSPIHLESQVSPQSPIHSESPIPPQSPIHLESPVPPQLPVHSETHVPPQSPIQSESPASPQSPIFSESPVPPQSPIHSETHVSPQSPIHSESPVPPQSPIHLESPIPPQSLIHSESPVLAQSPVPPRIPEPARSPSPVNASIDAQSISPVQSPISPQASSPIQFSAPLQFLSSSQFPSDGAHSSDIQAFNIQESQSFVSDQDNGVDVKQKSPEVLACRRYEIVLLKPEEELLIPVPISNTSDTLDVIPTSHSPVPSREIESPLEDITSSVKDSPPLASSPLDKVEDNNLDIMHEVVALVHETPRDISLLSNDDTLSSSQSKIETESVATTDINSFLERSLLPDVASPLSPNQQEDGIIFASPPITMESHDHVLEDVEVKSDVIAPEFPVQQEIVTTPVEAVVKSVASKKISGTPTKAKVGVTSATATAASKKPLPKVTAASTKPAVKSLVKTSAAVPPKAAPAKAALAKTSTTPVSSPKPLNKPSAKAPVTNGVTKAPLVTKTTSTISASAKPLPSKTTKPATTRTAVAPVAATTKPPASSTTARPSTLSSKTSTTSTTVKKVSVTSTVTNAKSTEKSTTSPKDSPKPRPTTASTGVTASARAKPAPIKLSTKTPESEKSVKEAANKQTALRAASAGTTKPAVRKSEPKMMSTTRTSLTKTAPTSLKGAGDAKKPQELIRHPVNKTKVRKIDSKETKVHENGVANELFTAELIKDASPIIENSQLLD